MSRFTYLSKKNEQGQAVVEFALLLPILLLLVLGIIQFGIIFSGYITVVSAAREGARVAIVGANDTAIKSKVAEIANSSPFLVEMVPDDPAIIINPPVNRLQQQPVTVQVTGNINIIIPFLSSIVGENIAITSAAEMRVEFVNANP